MRPGRAGTATSVATATTLALAAVLGLTPMALAQDTGDPLPEPGTALGDGRYSTDIVGPTIAFDGAEGWLVGPTGPGPIFTLLREGEPGTVVSVTRFDGAVFVDSCDPTSLTEVEATAPRLTAVIAGNPYLNPGTAVPTEVDGHAAWQLDVATPEYTECPLEFILLFALPVEDGGEFVQVADQQSRFIAIDVGDTVVVVAIESLPGVPFGELLEASLELVASMTIVPGEPGIPAADATPGPSPAAEASPSPAPTGPGGGATA